MTHTGFIKNTGSSQTMASLACAGVLAAAMLLTPSLMPSALAQTAAGSAPASHQPTFISADELITQATFLLMTDPQGTMQRLQRLGQNPALIDLLSKPHNQQVLDSGDADAIARLPEYQQLQKNADVMSLFSQYRMDDPRLATLVATYWERSQRLQHYPELQAVLNDPAVQAPLQAGNPLPLLMHPQGLTLLRTLFGASVGAPPAATP